MKYQAKDKSDLHKRLACILPQYPLISTFTGRSGVYKAVNADGNVFLVTWTIEEGQDAKRTERFYMDYNKLVRESDAQGAGWLKPDEGWSFEDY